MTIAANETNGAAIAVYGASGYTGRRVVRELVARGHRVVLAGRDARKLEQVAIEERGDLIVRVARLDDPAALVALTSSVEAIINCAGPFSMSCAPIVCAAIAGGAHYLDVGAEQHSTVWVFDKNSAAAHDAGVVLLPGLAFFAALSDMLASIAAVGLGAMEEVDVAYAITDWRPSAATFRARIEGMAIDWLTFDGGRKSQRGWSATTKHDFGGSVGEQSVNGYPTADVITIPRHVATDRVSVRITSSTLAPKLLAPFLPFVANASAALLRTWARPIVEWALRLLWGARDEGEMTSDPSGFHIVVSAFGAGGKRSASLTGRGIYDITAPMVAQAASRVVREGPIRAGALAPAEAFDARTFLDELVPYGVRWQLGNGAPC